MTDEPRVLVEPTAQAVSARAARHIAGVLAEAVNQHGRADWATTGGSTVVGIYQALASTPLRDRVPWERVHVWWGDDRFVPRDHPLSNALPVDEVLLGAASAAGQSGTGGSGVDVELGIEPGINLPVEQLHPFPTSEAIGEGLPPDALAARYEAMLRASEVAEVDGWPAFDQLLLGVGPDGHLLSVFPGSVALDEPARWALGIPAPTHIEPHVARVTLNPRVIEAARDVLVVVIGGAKSRVLAQIFGEPRDPRQWPAQLALRPGATWLLDADAAANLPSRIATSAGAGG